MPTPPPSRSNPRVIGGSFLGLLAVLLAAAAGCGSRPQAPTLRDGPVYQNKTAGFRFLVPQGWNQSTSSQLPPVLEREFVLTQYRLRTTPQGGLFEVICFEPKPDFDLATYHAGPSHGVKAWAPKEAPPDSAHAKLEGDRLFFGALFLGKPTTKEVLSVRRGTRVFSFIALYGDNDAAAREEVQRTLASLRWDG